MRFVQLFISVGMVPERELNPRESFWRFLRAESEWNGKVPDKV